MKRKVLLVVDMQDDFVYGPLGTEEAKEIVPKISDEIKNGGYDLVVFTKDIHGENYLDTYEGKNLPIRHCIRNTYGSNIVDDVFDSLNAGQDFIIVEKSMFGNYELPYLIQEKLKDMNDYCSKECCLNYFDDCPEFDGCPILDYEVNVVGVCTDYCVLANVMLLYFYICSPNKIRVLSTLCAGSTHQKHQQTLDILKHLFIDVV